MYIAICVAVAVVALALGCIATIAVQKSIGRSRAKTIIDEATREGEVLRQKEVLRGKTFTSLKKKSPASNLKPGILAKLCYKTMGFSSESSCSSKSFGII